MENNVEYRQIEESYLKYPHLNFSAKLFFKYFENNQPVYVIDEDGEVRLMRTASRQARITKMGWWFKKYNIHNDQFYKVEYAPYKNKIGIFLSVNFNTNSVLLDGKVHSIKSNIEQENYDSLDDLLAEFSENDTNLFELLLKINSLLEENHIQKFNKLVEKTIRKDTKLVQNLKKIANHRCQFPNCSNNIIYRADGSIYTEVAHIQAVSKAGLSKLGNLLVLCPNHHKEFDLGSRIIEEQTPKSLKGYLNKIPFQINLINRD